MITQKSIIVLFCCIVNFHLHAQSEMYAYIEGQSYMEWADEMNCNSTDLSIGTTIHELVCLGKEFLKLDSTLSEILRLDKDSIFINTQETWEKYREEQAMSAQRGLQNNLGKIDYLNALIFTTRNRISTIEEMRERY